MKTLQVISSGGMYGAEAVILNLARGLASGGHESVVGVFANTNGGDVQLYHEALRHGIRAHLFPCSGQLDRSVLPKLRGFVAEHGIDLVHTHGYKADVYGYLALRRSGIPLVATCHGWMDSEVKARAYAALDRALLRRFAGIGAVSEVIREILLRSGVRASRVRQIGNGIDPTTFQKAVLDRGRREMDGGVRGDALRVGLVGRLSHEKGIDVLLRAAAMVLKDWPEVHFEIAGGGPEAGSLDALARELGIERSVTFAGRCDRIPEFLASLDVVVSASRKEGLPMAILESMAAARPIVATSVGEVPLVLDHGEAGMLVPTEDAGALAEAIGAMLRDPDARTRYGARASERMMACYTGDRMTEAYLELYREVLEGSAAGGATRSAGGR